MSSSSRGLTSWARSCAAVADPLVHVGHLEAFGAFDGQGQPCRLADLVELGLIARLPFVDQPLGLGAQLLGIFVGQAGDEGDGPQAVLEGIPACTQFPLRGLRPCAPSCVLPDWLQSVLRRPWL